MPPSNTSTFQKKSVSTKKQRCSQETTSPQKRHACRVTLKSTYCCVCTSFNAGDKRRAKERGMAWSIAKMEGDNYAPKQEHCRTLLSLSERTHQQQNNKQITERNEQNPPPHQNQGNNPRELDQLLLRKGTSSSGNNKSSTHSTCEFAASRKQPTAQVRTDSLCLFQCCNLTQKLRRDHVSKQRIKMDLPSVHSHDCSRYIR